MRVDRAAILDEPFARAAAGRELVPAVPREMVEAGPVKDQTSRIETISPDAVPTPHNMTPREMANLSMELYASGVLSWEEYSMLAFQPELHPDYNRTIGALTGEKAEPDRSRDQVAEWEDRLAFEQKYNPIDDNRIRRTRRIVQVLKQVSQPTSMVA